MFLEGHYLLRKGVKSIFVIGLLLLSINQLSFAEESAFALSVNCSQVQAVTDENSTDGIGSFTINGGVTPFTFQVFDANNQVVSNGTLLIINPTIILNDLKGGTYRIEVMGKNETQSCAFTIGISNCILGVSVADATVNCASDLGSLSAVTTNGVAPLTYFWSTGATTPILSDVAPGNYTVMVTDNAGCVTSDMGTIAATSNSSVIVSITATTPATNFETDDGNVNFTVNGGASPYDIVITNTHTKAVIPLNNINTPTTVNLLPGNYSILATDNAGCTGTNTFQIGVTNCLFAVTVAAINPACDIKDNVLTAVPNNRGVLPFSYRWNTGSTSDTTSNLLPGIYAVTATDAVGCQNIRSRIISGNPPLQLTCNTTQNNTVIGGATGAATYDVSLGMPPYTGTLLRNGTAAFTDSPVSNGLTTLNGLTTGIYTLTIKDANNCTTGCNFEITEPACGITVTISDVTLPCVDERGTLQATIGGGVPPLTLEWSNDPTNSSSSNPNLLPGTYTLTVRDAVNCVKTVTATIFSRDKDGDGYFVGCATFPASALLADCDDNDNTAFPGAPEICDDKDNDCNGKIDEVIINGQPCASQVPIPTMSEWGLLIFCLLMLNLGVMGVLYRERLEKE